MKWKKVLFETGGNVSQSRSQARPDRSPSSYCLLMKKTVYIMFSLFLAGCATDSVIQSVQVNGKATATGIHYNLPKGLLKITVRKDTETVAQYNIEFRILYVPDVDHQFVLQYIPKSFSDDRLDINVDTYGFLANIESTNTSKVKEITVNLFSAAVSRPKEVLFQALKSPPPHILPQKIEEGTFIIDATNKSEITAISDSIPATISVNKISSEAIFDGPQSLQTGPTLFYRPLEPYLLNIKPENGKNESEIIYLPNQSPILSIDVVRAFLVSKVTKMTFENGIPVSMNISKPSEALELSKIPLDIVKALITAPAELVQLRINLTNNETKLLQAERDKLKAQLEFLQKQQESNERTQAKKEAGQ